MRAFSTSLGICLAGCVLAGCATTRHPTASVTRPAVAAALQPTVAQAAYLAADTKGEEKMLAPRALDTDSASAPVAIPQPVGLPDLIGLTLERNPRLDQVGWAVETARGRAIQAGLYLRTSPET